MSSTKKQKAAAGSPVPNGVANSSPATQPARSQSRQDTTEKQLSRSAAPTPQGSKDFQNAADGRPPTGRRRRKPPPPPPPVEETTVNGDPYVAAVQELQQENTMGAVMNVESAGDFTFDTSFDEFNSTLDGTGSAKDKGQNESTLLSVLLNPHYFHAIVVSIVAIFFIAAFAVYIPQVSKPAEKTELHLDQVAVAIQDAIDSLLLEYTSANAVQSVNGYGVSRNQQGSAQFTQDITNAIMNYKRAIDATQAKIGLAIQTHEDYLSTVGGALNGLLLDNALDMAMLEKTRDLVIKGASPASTIGAYDFILESLFTFSSKLLTNKMFRDPGDQQALNNVFGLVEQQIASVSAQFISYLNATSTNPNGLRSLRNYDEFYLSWLLPATQSVMETFMRYGTSNEVFGSDAVSNVTSSTYRTGLAQLNTITVPSAMLTLLSAETSQSFVGRTAFWNATYGGVVLDSILPALAPIVELNAKDDDKIFNSNTERELVSISTVVLLFCICVLAVIGHVASSIHYAQNKEDHVAREREVRIMQKSLSRMETFVNKASRLDVSATSAIVRKAQRARAAIPNEEQQLYNAMSSLRDMEYFLPLTVTRPPLELPQAALSKSDLFIKPALIHVKGIIAARMSLSTFHQQFANAGAKQKAVQHQMTRCLAAFQEIADEHVPGSACMLSVQGDHALLWINLLKKVSYPTMRAVSIAIALKEECDRLGFRQPYLSIACGDALVGHISSQSPSATSSYGHVMAFSAFGTLARDFAILDNLCHIHEAPVTLNNAAVLAFFEERVEHDSDVFNNPGASVGFAAVQDLGSEEQPLGGTVTPAADVNSPTATTPHLDGKQQITGKGGKRGGGGGGSGAAARERISIEERFRRMHCFFRPLEMVNAATSRVGEDTFALLEQHLTLTRERVSQLNARRGSNPILSNPSAQDIITLEDQSWYKDYSRDVADGSVVFPSYTIVPMTAAKKDEEKAMASWAAVFEAYAACCETCTADALSNAMNILSEFAIKYPHYAGAPVERMKKTLLAARNTGSIGVSAASLKKARLLDTLCV